MRCSAGCAKGKQTSEALSDVHLNTIECAQARFTL